jgi:hypothetical protein
MVGNLGDLVRLERADGLKVNGLGSEPEELLGVEEVPREVLELVTERSTT